MVQEFPPAQLPVEIRRGMRKASYRRDAEGAEKTPLILAEDADYAALDADICGWDYDWGHLRIGWLQADFAGAFAVETLEGGFIAAYQGDYDVAGVHYVGLFDDDEVTVEDVIVAHGFALDLQDEIILAASEIGERERFAIFDGFDGPAGSDAAEKRKIGGAPGDDGLGNGFHELRDFDRAALVVAAADEAFLFERGEMLVHRGERGELERAGYFFEARRVTVLVHEGYEVIENLLLALGQGHGRVTPQIAPSL